MNRFHVFVYMAKTYVDLEGCPFCGCEPDVVEPPGWYYIRCTNRDCGCIQHMDKDLNVVVQKWNTRA